MEKRRRTIACMQNMWVSWYSNHEAMIKRLTFPVNPFEINLPWGNVERVMPCTTPSMPTKMRSGARAASIGTVLERAAFAPLRACSVIPVSQRTRDLWSRFSRVQCPISPAILLFLRDWSTISAPGVAWSAFCAPGTCSVQLPAECLRSSSYAYHEIPFWCWRHRFGV